VWPTKADGGLLTVLGAYAVRINGSVTIYHPFVPVTADSPKILVEEYDRAE
jgi:hypothetical protein